MKKKELHDLVYRSFDAPLSDKEKNTLETGLQNSAGLKEEYDYLAIMRKAVKNNAQTTFKPYFEERLLNRLNQSAKPQTRFDPASAPLFASFGRIAIAAVIILIVLISYNLNNGNSYSIDNLFGNSKTTVASAFDPFQNTLGVNK